MSSMNALRSPVNVGVGPLSTLAAATRSSFCAERQRAKTASAIRVSGMPRSSAVIDGPLAGALLAGGVEDHVDQRLAGLGSL